MNKTIEVYKCFVLTVIAGVLIAILFKIPIPERQVTVKDVMAKKVKLDEIPVVRVTGNVDANITNTPNVEVENTVDVTGEVSISPY